MSAEQNCADILQQYENMIGNIAEWRTNIYNILQLAPWKKQYSPRMQSDITVIQNALTLPLNFEIGDFALQQVNIMINYKSIFEQILAAHKKLVIDSQLSISPALLLDLEQKTIALLTYFNYIASSSSLPCQPLCRFSRSSFCKCQPSQQGLVVLQNPQEQSQIQVENDNNDLGDISDHSQQNYTLYQQGQAGFPNQAQGQFQQKQQSQGLLSNLQQQYQQFQPFYSVKQQTLPNYSQVQ